MAEERAADREKEFSRRKFLTAGAVAAGAVAAGGVLGVQPSLAAGSTVKVLVDGKEMTGPVPASIVRGTAVAPVRPLAEALGAEVTWEGKDKTVRIASSRTAAAIPPYPWPYRKLNLEVVDKKGVEGYKKWACCQGTAYALLTELGYPYTIIPLELFKYGEGGVVGWGSHCGALNGASAVISLVHHGDEVSAKLINELTGWYIKEWGSGSPLCHISVTEWSKKTGFNVESQQRKDRCAQLTGSVAAYTAKLLNDQAEGKLAAAFSPQASTKECLSCHGKDKIGNVRAIKQDCLPCHEPHKK